MTQKINKPRKLKIKTRPLIFICLALLLTAYITYATLFSSNALLNKFKTMTYNVSLEEEFYDDWGTKKVYINNKDLENSLILRVNYAEVWSKEVDGKLLYLSNKVNGQDVVDKKWTSTFTDNFIKGSDGWYYYKKLLKPGEKILLLEEINLDDEVVAASPYAKDYKSYNYELTFGYETIQGDANAAQKLWNKTITISEDNVNWTL